MKPGRFNLLLYLALMALAAEVVFLVIQNRRLQAQIIALTTPPPTLKKGEKVTAINLLSTSRTTEKLDFGSDMPSRLLFIFSTRCPACQKTLPIWKQLATEVPASVQILGIASDSLATALKYQKEHALNYPVFIAADTLFKAKYKIFSVPQTILIDGSGTVSDLWSGTLQDSQLAKIREIVRKLGNPPIRRQRRKYSNKV